MIDVNDSHTGELPVTTESELRMHFLSVDRSYTVLLIRDLFDVWTVVQAWGGRYSARGGKLSRAVQSFTEGWVLMNEIEKKRLRHGYQRVTPEQDNACLGALESCAETSDFAS